MIVRSLWTRLVRTTLLLLLVCSGTLALTRYAPGYFSDSRELDAQFGSAVRADLAARRAQDGSVLDMGGHFFENLAHGSLGTSRHYHVPVTQLLWPTLPVTASLVLEGALLAWCAAFAAALAGALGRRGLWTAGSSLLAATLIAVPVGALATLLVVSGWGGALAPVITLAAVLAAQNFAFLLQLFRRSARSPHLFFARAQGLGPARVVVSHLLRPVLAECGTLFALSLLSALSLAVPVEVLFSLPGLGQLAWTAAMNRDTAVLVAATLVMAVAVAATRVVSPPAEASLRVR